MELGTILPLAEKDVEPGLAHGPSGIAPKASVRSGLLHGCALQRRSGDGSRRARAPRWLRGRATRTRPLSSETRSFVGAALAEKG